MHKYQKSVYYPLPVVHLGFLGGGGGCRPLEESANLLCGIFVVEYCMKVKKLDWEERSSQPPPPRPAPDCIHWSDFISGVCDRFNMILGWNYCRHRLSTEPINGLGERRPPISRPYFSYFMLYIRLQQLALPPGSATDARVFLLTRWANEWRTSVGAA